MYVHMYTSKRQKNEIVEKSKKTHLSPFSLTPTPGLCTHSTSWKPFAKDKIKRISHKCWCGSCACDTDWPLGCCGVGSDLWSGFPTSLSSMLRARASAGGVAHRWMMVALPHTAAPGKEGTRQHPYQVQQAVVRQKPKGTIHTAAND